MVRYWKATATGQHFYTGSTITIDSGSTLTLNGTLSGTIGCASPATLAVATDGMTVDASGNTAIKGTLAVTGASTLTGAVTTTGALYVGTSGYAGSGTTLTAAGAVSMKGALVVAGASTLTGAVTMTASASVGTTLAVTGQATFAVPFKYGGALAQTTAGTTWSSGVPAFVANQLSMQIVGPDNTVYKIPLWAIA